ncbi:beta/gamma crystallin-related protein [Parvibaculum sedimenti]|nr:beta/gamma crystallin-related protein [Parvibaculum sedimenti]
MKLKIGAKALAAVVVMVMVLPGLAEARGAAVLYQHERFGGGAVRIDRDVPDLGELGINDAASSISVRGGAWEICEHVHYRGRCIVVDGDVADFREIGLNDKVSSIRRVDDRGGYGGGYPSPGPRDRAGGITVFQDFRFSGGSMSFSGDVPDLGRYGINDRISSIDVSDGVWEVCEHIRYRGRCVTVDGRIANLDRMGFNDKISSIRRLR